MKQGLQLTPRLQAVADLVPQGAAFADIGTDHAYLPAWLLLNGCIDHAIASDINAGPLSRARRTAEDYGCTQHISFRLGAGLAKVRPEEADTVAIAGMGGETIAQILSDAPWTREQETLLLLQPMSAQEELRRYLWLNGYTIHRENIVREGQKLYLVLEPQPERQCFPPVRPSIGWAAWTLGKGIPPFAQTTLPPRSAVSPMRWPACPMPAGKRTVIV